MWIWIYLDLNENYSPVYEAIVSNKMIVGTFYLDRMMNVPNEK